MYTGFIEFGSENAIASASLKTSASITSLGTGSDVASGATINSSLGTIGSTTGAVKMVIDNLPSDIHIAGQISWNITTSACATPTASTGSEGTDRANNTYHFSCATTDGGGATTWGRVWQDVNETFKAELVTTDTHTTLDSNQGGTGSQKIHSLGKENTVQFTISWNYAQVEYFIDHVWYGKGNRASITSDIFKYIYLGSAKAITSGGTNLTVQDGYYSNFVISNIPVRLASNPNMKKVIFFGDSIAGQADPEITNGFFGNNASIVLEAELHKKGLSIDAKVTGISGATVDDSGGTNLQDNRTTMLAERPDLVIFQGGTNDVTSWATYSSSFDTDLKDHMTTILAVAKNIIISTVPTLKADATYNTQQIVTDTAACNVLINALPTW